MRRALRLLAGLLLAAGLAAGAGLAWLHWLGSPLEARFGPEDCKRLALTDAETGAPIVGIEDIAAYGEGLFLSAQDRLAAEAAGGEGRAAPEGAIYRLAKVRLGAEGPLSLRPYTADGFGSPLHPHGIDAGLAKLVAVNRRFGPDGAEGMEIRVYAIRETHLEPLLRLPDPGLCAANDLVLAGGAVWVTLDRSACPGRSLREMASGAPTGALARMGVTDGSSASLLRLAEGLSFANGIALAELGAGRMLAVSETRGEQITLLDPPGGQSSERRRSLPTPGAPDNLTIAPDGRILAALHPSLLRLALYRFGWTEAAPSRLALIDPESGAAELLYDDPPGAGLSAATVGVLTEGGVLVAGSVRDAGLLVCGAAA